MRQPREQARLASSADKLDFHGCPPLLSVFKTLQFDVYGAFDGCVLFCLWSEFDVWILKLVVDYNFRLNYAKYA